MSHVDHEITINVPVEKVYAALLDVDRAPEWMVNLEEIRNVTGRNQGDSFEWTFKMTGMKFRGKTIFAIVEPNKRLREEGSGDLTNTWDWSLAPASANSTNIQVGIEYTVPGGKILGGIADKLFVERQNEKDLKTSL
jgi:uncharacterized membrane protein